MVGILDPEEKAPKRMLSIARITAWRTTLQLLEIFVLAGFGALCLRDIWATVAEATNGKSLWSALVLGLGAFSLPILYESGGFIAFLCAVPALNAIGLLQLTGTVDPLPFAFSCAMLGRIPSWSRRFIQRPASQFTILFGPEDAGTSGRLWIGGEAERAMTLMLMTAILLSFLWQLMLFGYSDHALWTQATFGWSDGRYFVTAAFIWLCGLYAFLECSSLVSCVFIRARLLIVAWAASIASFFLIQYWFHVPEPLVLWPYQGKVFSLGYSGPFDDMHSFGSVLVCLLGIFLWATEWRRGFRLLIFACFSFLVLMIILSYGRANWVAALCIILGWAVCRLPKWTSVCMLGLVALSVVVIDFGTSQTSWLGQTYRYRLYSLVRIEAPSVKLSSRFFMFHKAREAIAAHPLAGLGIGQFYAHSPRYALEGDPLAHKMDFAHDLFLQFASEMGIPCGVLLAILIFYAIRPSLREFVSSRPIDRLRFGIFVGICGYISTQITAHALNIFLSNQLVIWALIGIASAGKREIPEASKC